MRSDKIIFFMSLKTAILAVTLCFQNVATDAGHLSLSKMVWH
jgi:hypothetical protein